MAITDATTSLALTWTESSTVSFNANTLADIDSCVSEVESRMKRGTLSGTSSPTLTQVKNWLIFAKQELSAKKGFTFKRRYASVSTTAATYRYALPPDFNGGRVALKDTTNNRYLTPWPPDQFDMKYPDVSEEENYEPIVFTIKNLELWLAPPPNGTYTLEIEYDRSGADNTANDFSWLPELERFRCCDYAAFRGFMSLHMFEVANMYQSLWRQSVGDAVREDGKRKWKQMSYRAIGWMQAHNLKNYQP